MLFGPFVRKCPWLGYLLSSGLFSFIHIMNSIGAQSVRDLLLCFLQYVPLSLALCWVYQKTKSIWGSIVLHCAVNTISCLALLASSMAQALERFNF